MLIVMSSTIFCVKYTSKEKEKPYKKELHMFVIPESKILGTLFFKPNLGKL